MALLEVRGLTRRFGGLVAVDAIDLEVHEGETVSVIGPNGAGKTTLFNLISGTDRPDSGSITFNGKRIDGHNPVQIAEAGIARTFQHGRVFGNLTVLENVLVGAHTRMRVVRPFRNLGLAGALVEAGLALVRPGSVKAEEERLKAEAREILATFGERLLPRQDHLAFSLSYANRRRTEIARALALKPHLLLLDEPTAGMNPTETDEIMEIIRALGKTGLTILLIEHKLSLVMQVSNRVIVMDYGKEIAAGKPEEVQNDPKVIEAYLGRKSTPVDLHEAPSKDAIPV